MGIGKGVIGLGFSGNRTIDHDFAATAAEGHSRVTVRKTPAVFRTDIDQGQRRQARRWGRREPDRVVDPADFDLQGRNLSGGSKSLTGRGGAGIVGYVTGAFAGLQTEVEAQAIGQ
ncbi:hypothetical protein D3C71_1482850 [compost metagenome]